MCAGKKPDNAAAENAALTGLQEGNLLAKKADWNGAIRQFSLALLQNPPADLRVRLLQARGEAYLSKGWLMGGFFSAIVHHAVKDFSRVIALRADEADGYLWRARALSAGFQHRRALPDFDTAVQIASAPNNSGSGDNALAATALRERGAVHERLQNREQALADYCEALERGGWHAAGHAQTLQKAITLAKVCIARHEFDTGINALKRISDAEPGEREPEIRALLFEAFLKEAAAAAAAAEVEGQ